LYYVLVALVILTSGNDMIQASTLPPGETIVTAQADILSDSITNSVTRFALMTSPQPQNQTQTQAAEIQCAVFRASLPRDYFQEYIEVPENWNEPGGRKINVFYYGRKNTTNKVPVVYFNGGPGHSSHEAYRELDTDAGYKLRSSNLSMIYIDQRGTGCSTNLAAEATSENFARATQYGSRNIVRDAEAIRSRHLGATTPWKVFGQSYGALIAHRYAILYPTSLISVHAHGYSLTDDSVAWMKHRIRSQERVLQTYFKHFPEDRERLMDLRKSISNSDCFSSRTVAICGAAVIDSIYPLLAFQDRWRQMHDLISRSSVTHLAQLMIFGQHSQNQLLLDFAITATEMKGGHGRDITELCQQVNTSLKEDGHAPDSWALNECRYLSDLVTPYSALIKNISFDQAQLDPVLLKDLKLSLDQNPTLQFYLSAGHLDSLIPTEAFEEEVAVLGTRINYTIFENSGHEGYRTEDKIWAELSQPQ
jgi:pimeloyl-ACP methyl ester carboxylesterase